MTVTPTDVKKLRAKTGAGMLDCKKALVTCQGDFASAERHLKEQGLAIAEARAGRATGSGALFVHKLQESVGMIELSCETDFVAKNEVFRRLGASLAEKIVSEDLTETTPETTSMLREAIAVLKENMALKKISLIKRASENDLIVSYLHNQGEMGALVLLRCDSKKSAQREEVAALGLDLALHAVAFMPPFLNEKNVPNAYLEEQKAIFAKQAEGMGKPDHILAGIIAGKVKKHLAQICFLEQEFVKNDKIRVKEALAETSRTIGGTISLEDYVCHRVGDETNT